MKIVAALLVLFFSFMVTSSFLARLSLWGFTNPLWYVGVVAYMAVGAVLMWRVFTENLWS